MAQPIICLVTVHGIGFQAAPQNGEPGYADRLHAMLSNVLGPSVLGDDPNRKRSTSGEAGPVYVQSSWPPDTNQIEAGLTRLGTWTADGATIDASKMPLVNGGQQIGHVALVYSRLEDQDPHIETAFQTSSMALSSFGHYISAMGLARLAITDIQSIISHPDVRQDSSDVNLRVRTGDQRTETGLLSVIRQLETDVASYVCRDDLRERVRTFVLNALLRLCDREDVAGIVLNTHSNGTVIGFDALRRLPPHAARKVRAFITSGSALRKYAMLFNWTTEVGGMVDAPAFLKWTNFWDPVDPVADPLSPNSSWRRGDDWPEDTTTSLYYRLDPHAGSTLPVRIEDVRVDNLRNSSGGGLQAHNYWDNRTEVVIPISRILREAANS